MNNINFVENPTINLKLQILISMLIFLSLTSCIKENPWELHIPPGQPCPGDTAITYEGISYPTTQIGNQCWLTRNLNIGVMINSSQVMSDNNVLEKYCYQNDTMYCDTFGGLYQWDEIMQYTQDEGARGICPEGWHIPTNREIGNLLIYLNGQGIYLKKNDSLWDYNYPDNPENYTGFDGIPGGYFSDLGTTFTRVNKTACFWTSHEIDSGNATNFEIHPWNEFAIYNWSKKYGYSVRCIKDE